MNSWKERAAGLWTRDGFQAIPTSTIGVEGGLNFSQLL